ncbi:unnamed protein product [Ascophyllum nodosum]
MAPRSRSRSGVRTTRMWVLGVFFTTTCSARTFCISTRSPWVRISGDRLLSRPARGLDQTGCFVHRYSGFGVTLGVVTPARGTDNLLAMKVPKVGKKPSPGNSRRQRGGPRTNAEGYTAEAFVDMRHEVALQVANSIPCSRKEVKKINFDGGLDSCPCLVLNADYQPLSYLPLSLWGWQDVIKAVFMEKVVVVATYGDRKIRSARMEVKLPSVIALKEFVNQHRTHPAFTRRNLFLRDEHKCQYCLKYFPPQDLSFDHVVPKKLGGKGTWNNVVTACGRCNNRKSDCHPRDLRSIGMSLSKWPKTPTFHELQVKARRYPPREIHETWGEFLYFESEIVDNDKSETAA